MVIAMSRKNNTSQFEIMRLVKESGRRMGAYAIINGGPNYKDIHGIIFFNESPRGSWIDVEMNGLPRYKPLGGGLPPIGPFGFHIHEGGDCTVGDNEMPFMSAGGHFNPHNQPHGNHAGDFPVLFSNSGYSRMSFFTDKFRPEDIIGKTVIVHLNPDDYRTDPAGNSGKRIACGVIKRY